MAVVPRSSWMCSQVVESFNENHPCLEGGCNVVTRIKLIVSVRIK